MSDEPDSLVLRYLLALDSKVDRVIEELREIKGQLDHIERRLGLTEA